MSLARRRVMGLAAAWTLGAGAPLDASTAEGAAAAVQWPALTLLDGRPWALPIGADGRPFAVVAVIWASDCPFCRRHNVHLDKLQRAAAGKPLAIVTAAQDRDPAVVDAYLRERDYRFPVVREHQRLRALFTDRRVIPFTATVGRDGRIRERIPGEMFEEDVLGFLGLAG